MTKLICLPVAGAVLALLPPTAALSQSGSQPSAEPDDEIIVTASPLGGLTSESLVGVSVVGKEELSQRMAGSVGELLKYEPGVSSTFFGPGASRPVIRGQGGDRIRMLDNGIGSIDASSSSPDHAVAAEPALAERVEIIRGSGLLRYGSSGSGGVINVIDGRIPNKVPDNPIEGAARAGYSTVDEGRELSFGANFKPTYGGALVPVFHAEAAWRKTDDYGIPGFTESERFRALEEEEVEAHEGEEHPFGTVENAASDSFSVALGASLIGENGYFGLAVKSLDSEYGIPGGHGHEEGEEEEAGHEEEGGVHVQLKQFRYDANGSLTLHGGWIERVDLFAGIADYKHSEIEGDGAIGTVFRNQGWEGRAEFIQRQRGQYRAAYGLHFRNREFSAIGEEAFVPPTDTEQVGLYTFQETSMGDWHFETAGRLERTTHTRISDGVDQQFDGISVSFGLDRHVSSSLKIGGTLFRTERAPTSDELFANGPHLATAQFEIGNISLGKEVATGGEMVARYDQGNTAITLNLYRTWYAGYIFGEETGAVEDGLEVFAFTASDAVFQGFEFQLEQNLGQWAGWDWQGLVQLDLVDAYLTEGAERGLPRIPPASGLFRLEADQDAFSVYGEVFVAAKVDSATEHELDTDGYALLNVGIAWRPLVGTDGVTIRIAGNNLLDSEARQHTSFLKDVVPLPGRNVRLSLDVAF